MYKKIAIRNISTSFIWQMATMISGLLLPGMIINHYGSELNGLIASMTSFLSYISVMDSGVAGVIKAELYPPLAHKRWKEVSSILTAARLFFRRIAKLFLIYVLALILIYPKLVNTSFSFSTIAALILVLSSALFFEYYSGLTNRILIMSDKKHALYNLLQTILVLLNLGISIGLIFLDQSILLVKIASSIVFLINPLVLAVYVKRKYPIDETVLSNEEVLKQRWDGIGHHVAKLSRNNVDIFLLTLFFSVKEISIYSIYLMILNVLTKFIGIFTNGVEAFLGELLALEKRDRLEKYFSFYQFWYTTIAFTFCVTACTVSFPFLSIYILNAESQGYLNDSFMLLMFCAQLVFLLKLPFSNLVLAAGKYKETKKYAFIEVIINVVSSCLFLFLFGMSGLALGTLLGSVYHFVQLFLFFKNHYFENLWKEQIKQLTLFFCLSIIIMLVAQTFPISITDLASFLIVSSIYFLLINGIFMLIIGFFFRKKLTEFLHYFTNKWIRT